MKQIHSTIMMLALMVAALSFTACGSDDDDEGEFSSSDIVGTWKGENIKGWILDEELIGEYDEDEIMSVLLQFRSDGKCISVGTRENENENEVMYANWHLNYGRLSLYFPDDGDTYVVDVISLNKKKLVISFLGVTFYYDRVPDSEINKYLR